MNRVIKFRQWVPGLNQYIGFWGTNIDPHGAYWVGPASESESIHEQFTGLKDKNGREIYEGDILTAEGYPWFDDGAPNYRAVVEYGTDAMFLAVKVCINPAKRGISHGIAESLGEVEGWEIIGNIHENPGMESNPSREKVSK